MNVTTLYLMRHGEVDNPGGISYGRLPGFSLSDRGRAQVRRSVEALSKAPRAIITSPLERARETGAIASAHFGVRAHVDERLIERGSIRDGLPRRPAPWALMGRLISPTWRATREPQERVMSRMQSALYDAAERFGGSGPVLLVSHQVPIWLGVVAAELALREDAAARLADLSPWLAVKTPCEVASIHTLTLLGRRVLSVKYASHGCKDRS